MNERTERARAALRRHGMDAAVVASAHNVCYFGGYAAPVEVGVSPFVGGPHLATLDADGRVTLIVPDTEEGEARANGDADEVIGYAAYDIRERIDPVANEGAALRRALSALQTDAARSVRLGVEFPALPLSLWRTVAGTFDTATVADATHALADARLIKTADELEKLRRALDLATAGQDAARRLLRAGMTEIELFAGVRAVVEARAGGRVPLAGDLVAGAGRTAAGGGWPTGYQIADGDLVLVDLVPRHAGYWGDSCNTLCAGEPTVEQTRMRRATVEALARGIAAIRPGVRAGEIDRVCREHVRGCGYAYPHHTGHAIGTTMHEDPRLVPYETTPLQAGMVLALEPAAYVPGVGGARSEHVVLVADAGAEILSTFEHAF